MRTGTADTSRQQSKAAITHACKRHEVTTEPADLPFHYLRIQVAHEAQQQRERRSFFLFLLDGSTPGGDMSCPQCMPALSNHTPHPPSKQEAAPSQKVETTQRNHSPPQPQQTRGSTLPKQESPAHSTQGRKPNPGDIHQRGAGGRRKTQQTAPNTAQG